MNIPALAIAAWNQLDFRDTLCDMQGIAHFHQFEFDASKNGKFDSHKCMDRSLDRQLLMVPYKVDTPHYHRCYYSIHSCFLLSYWRQNCWRQRLMHNCKHDCYWIVVECCKCKGDRQYKWNECARCSAYKVRRCILAAIDTQCCTCLDDQSGFCCEPQNPTNSWQNAIYPQNNTRDRDVTQNTNGFANLFVNKSPKKEKGKKRNYYETDALEFSLSV